MDGRFDSRHDLCLQADTDQWSRSWARLDGCCRGATPAEQHRALGSDFGQRSGSTNWEWGVSSRNSRDLDCAGRREPELLPSSHLAPRGQSNTGVGLVRNEYGWHPHHVVEHSKQRDLDHHRWLRRLDEHHSIGSLDELRDRRHSILWHGLDTDCYDLQHDGKLQRGDDVVNRQFRRWQCCGSWWIHLARCRDYGDYLTDTIHDQLQCHCNRKQHCGLLHGRNGDHWHWNLDHELEPGHRGQRCQCECWGDPGISGLRRHHGHLSLSLYYGNHWHHPDAQRPRHPGGRLGRARCRISEPVVHSLDQQHYPDRHLYLY